MAYPNQVHYSYWSGDYQFTRYRVLVRQQCLRHMVIGIDYNFTGGPSVQDPVYAYKWIVSIGIPFVMVTIARNNI